LTGYYIALDIEDDISSGDSQDSDEIDEMMGMPHFGGDSGDDSEDESQTEEEDADGPKVEQLETSSEDAPAISAKVLPPNPPKEKPKEKPVSKPTSPSLKADQGRKPNEAGGKRPAPQQTQQPPKKTKS